MQISYIIRPHVDQNTQESWTTARVTKENGLSRQEKGPFLQRKRLRSVRKKHGAQEKGMALQEKGMTQRHAKRA